jgi:hypothetical protein
MFKLRDYQVDLTKQCREVLKSNKICILNAEVRCGKTHVALSVASHYNNVLFVTKKKAISSIEDDYKTAEHKFNITIINYESLHKVSGVFDLVICDESHSLSAFPKPSKRTKAVKGFVVNDLLLLTGTLLPESNSQIFHQLWVSPYSPYKNCGNFYKWFKIYGTPKVVYTSYGEAKDYSCVDYDKIKTNIDNLKVSFTQEEAGFTSTVKEHIINVDMLPSTYKLIEKLKKDNVVEGRDEIILADTGVKLMSKIHQLSSGTIKFESGNKKVLDYSKAEYIKENFKGKKLAIFYKFTAELDAIKEHLDITQDISEFNTTDKHIALQIVSGREGINLSSADVLIYYNIDFSAVSYWQSRDRLTTKERLSNSVYWLFSKGGIEHKIYKSVLNKKNYTLQTFKKEI